MNPRVLCTPRELYKLLHEEGYSVTYRRIPLSRERTPEAGDLEMLHEQAQSIREGLAGQVVHLIVSRTATGSSARFAAAALCCGMIENPTRRNDGLARMSKRLRRSNSDLGEYRGIMSLCRLLPAGFEMKLVVDEAIERCSEEIGNLKGDIKQCKVLSEMNLQEGSGPRAADRAWATRQLGIHYLRRYFYLIAYRCYQELGESRAIGFAQWASIRKELKYLLTHLDLET